MRSRLVIITLLVCLVALLLPAVALAWSNGDDHGNGFGTHDWVLQEADRLAAKQSAGWVKLSVALPKTDDPDTVFHDTYYHVYDVWGASTYGDAPKKVSEYYGKALAARKAGDWTRPASTSASWRTTTPTSAIPSTPTRRSPKTGCTRATRPRRRRTPTR